MPLSSARDERGFLRLTIDGPWPTLAELMAWYKLVGDLRAMRLLLIDIRGSRGAFPRFPDIRDTVGAFESDVRFASERRRAVVVSSDVQFGVARSFEALVTGEMQVFRDEPSAIAWLLAGSNREPS